MGTKRARRAERRQRRRDGLDWWDGDRARGGEGVDGTWPGSALGLTEGREGSTGELGLSLVESPSVRTCGRCREFVEDGELGRGTCLHPGSGVLHPWTDTPGCGFWAGGGRSAGRQPGS